MIYGCLLLLFLICLRCVCILVMYYVLWFCFVLILVLWRALCILCGLCFVFRLRVAVFVLVSCWCLLLPVVIGCSSDWLFVFWWYELLDSCLVVVWFVCVCVNVLVVVWFGYLCVVFLAILFCWFWILALFGVWVCLFWAFSFEYFGCYWPIGLILGCFVATMLFGLISSCLVYYQILVFARCCLFVLRSFWMLMVTVFYRLIIW